MRVLFFTALVSSFLSSCIAPRSSELAGGDRGPREVSADDVQLPEGYELRPRATRLTYPTGLAFDAGGHPYVVESGYSWGESFTTPRLLRIESDGTTTEIAHGENAPWNGLAFFRGAFYVAEGGALRGGRIIRIDPDGTITPVVDGLPSLGDHHTNGPVVGPDGYLYFGQGTATNSGVVGADNAVRGWLMRSPRFHDVPCEDVTLAGENFETANVLSAEGRGKATTGAFSPFGVRTRQGEVIHGRVPCSGAIMRVALVEQKPEPAPASAAGSGSCGEIPDFGPATAASSATGEEIIRGELEAPELVAWGFRNPYGLAFSPDGRLFSSDGGYDDRGSRPIASTPGVLWQVMKGSWYGWPDWSAGQELGAEAGKNHRRVLATYPAEPPKPLAVFPAHSSAAGLDFSENPNFGFSGEVFVALFGDFGSMSGKLSNPVGYEVVRVDVATGKVTSFAVNRGEEVGPASKLGTGGLERPIIVRFDPTGESLWIVDFGIIGSEEGKLMPQPFTGVVWQVSKNLGPIAARE